MPMIFGIIAVSDSFVPIFFGNACLYNKILCVICKAFFQKSGPISQRNGPANSFLQKLRPYG
jgi:hypothetical protein